MQATQHLLLHQTRLLGLFQNHRYILQSKHFIIFFYKKGEHVQDVLNIRGQFSTANL